MKKVFFIVLFHLSIMAVSQSVIYNITSNDLHIGELKATQTIRHDTITIKVFSHVEVKLFVNVDLEYKLYCTYINNKLWYSKVETYVNGNRHSVSITERKADFYILTKDGKSKRFYNDILFSGALLYFYEPKNRAKIYSEFDLIEKPIETIDKGTYQITNPINGNLSEYNYKSDVLFNLVMHHTLLTFTITKK